MTPLASGSALPDDSRESGCDGGGMGGCDWPLFPDHGSDVRRNNDCTDERDWMHTDEAGRNLDERDRHWLTKMDEMNQRAFPPSRQTTKKTKSIHAKRKRNKKPKKTKMNRFGYTKCRI